MCVTWNLDLVEPAQPTVFWTLGNLDPHAAPTIIFCASDAEHARVVILAPRVGVLDLGSCFDLCDYTGCKTESKRVELRMPSESSEALSSASSVLLVAQ